MICCSRFPTDKATGDEVPAKDLIATQVSTAKYFLQPGTEYKVLDLTCYHG